MSNQNKTTAHLQTDSETGIVLAHTAHAAGVEARRAELTDPKAISKAQEDLGAFENRLTHLSGLSDIFDDEDDEPISMGTIAPAEPDITPTDEAPATPDLDEADALGMDEEFVIGGLSDEEDDDLLGNVFPDDDLMAPFDDDAISGAVEDVMPETAVQDEELTDFQVADDAELERNREVSEAAYADAEDLTEDDLSFLHDDQDEAAIGDDEDDEDQIDEPVAISIADEDGPESDVPQSLSSLVSGPAAKVAEVDPARDLADMADPVSELADPEAGAAPAGAEDDLQSLEDMLDADTVDTAGTQEDEAGSSFDEMPVPDWANTEDGLSVPGSDYAEDASDPVDDGEDLLAWAENDPAEADEASAPAVDGSNSVDFSDVGVFDTVEEGDTPAYATDVADYRDGTEGPDAVAGMPDLSLEEGDTGVSDNAKNKYDDDEVLADADTSSSDDTGWLDTGDDQAEDTVAPGGVTDADPAGEAEPAAPVSETAKTKKSSSKMFYATAAITALVISAGGYIGLQKMQGIPDVTASGNQPVISAPQTAEDATNKDTTDVNVPQAVAEDGIDAGADPDVAPVADEMFEENMGDVTADPMATPEEVEDIPADPVTDIAPSLTSPDDVLDEGVDAPVDDGSLSDLMLDDDITDPVSEDMAEGVLPAVTDEATQDLADAANGNIDSLFLEDEPEVEAEEPAVTEDMLAGFASQDDVVEIREAIDLMFDQIETISDEVVERDEAIVDLTTRLADAEARAQRAETLALGQNEVLAEFLRVKEKVDMAENLIVDLSRRTAAMETTDPADRVAVERSINDLNDRLEGVARDLGLIARVAINGSPARVQTGSNPGTPDVPGAGAVYEQSTGGISAPGEAAEIPNDVKVGDFVQGYGHVLQIMPTSDGARVVVMENKSVLIP